MWKHKFLQIRNSNGLLLDITRDSHRAVNIRLQNYHQRALEDQHEFERVIFEQQVGLPKNPLMSPVILSVTGTSNASSSLISNLSVQKIKICEDISQTLNWPDSMSFSDNLSRRSDLNTNSKLSHLSYKKSFNLYSATRKGHQELMNNRSFQKSRSSRNSLRNKSSRKMSWKRKKRSYPLMHKKSISSNTQVLEKNFEESNAIYKTEIDKMRRLKQIKIQKRETEKNVTIQELDSGSSRTPVSFNNRLTCNLYR